MIALTPRPPRVLVIGWGFVGAAIGEHLHRATGSVIGFTSRPSVRTRHAEAQGIEIMIGQAEEPGAIEAVVGRVDHVVYAAGGLLPVEAAVHPELDAARTLLSWIATLEALRRGQGQGVTLVSSGGTVYGNPARIPVHEDDRLAPISTYGASRLACAIYGDTYARTYGIRVQVVRCANLYGPGQPADRGQGMVAVFMEAARHGRPFTIVGDGSNVRDYVHIDDAADAVARLVYDRSPVDIVNIGSGRGHSNVEVVELLKEVTGVCPPIHYAPARPHDVRAIVLDITRLRSLIAYEPMPLEQGLRATWEAVEGNSRLAARA